MPHDPTRLAEVRAWLTLAIEDLRAADHELTASPPILGDLVFHCQQAVEKLFKGFLVWHDVVFRKTHNLESLVSSACGSTRHCVKSSTGPFLSPSMPGASAIQANPKLPRTRRRWMPSRWHARSSARSNRGCHRRSMGKPLSLSKRAREHTPCHLKVISDSDCQPRKPVDT
jgi:hypothetical protein